jgi:predicted unusual protein kinase regulating ubiquinone biosynthesis (AarF/ABC1/UbiB family)
MRESAAAIKRHRTARLARLVGKAFYLHRRRRTEEMYNMICEEFIALGGVYIKFLQGVLLSSEMMRKLHNPERLRIFENLDHEPVDVVAVLRHELKPEQLQQITGIQPEPFAAGSFGQVYYGQHINGKPIIIKVLRPMVRELLRYDLRLISAFSRRFFIKLYPNADFNIDQAMRDFRDATLSETDYIQEARFAAEMYQAYRDHPHFIVPETFVDLCTSHIIVQEYVDGISAAQVIKMQEQGVDPKVYVEEQLGSDIDAQLTTLGFEAINGIFNLPRIQGDPHPGNVRFMTGNRVGIIDFGISAITPKNKGAFFGLIEEWSRMYSDRISIVNLFEQFIRFFVSDLYKALKKLSTLAKVDTDSPNFTQEVGKIAQSTFSRLTGERDIQPLIQNGRIMVIINQMVNKNNRFGLVIRLEASEILRAAQTYMTLVDTLGRRNEVLPNVFAQVIAQVEKDHPELRHENEDTMSIANALDTVSNWLERVAERDPALFAELMHRIRLNKTVDVVKET